MKSTKIQKEKLDEIREKYIRKAEFVKRLGEIEEAIHKLKSDKDEITTKLIESKDVNSKVREVEKKIKEYEKLTKDLEKNIEGKTQLVNEFKIQKKKLATDFEEIKKLGPKSRCPKCHKIIGKDYQEIIEHFKKEVEEIDSKIKLQNEAKKKLTEQNVSANTLLEAAKTEEKQVSKRAKQITKEEERKKSLQKQIGEQTTLRSRIRRQMQGLGKVRYDEESHNKLKELLKGLLELEKKKIELENEASRIPDTKASIIDITKKLNSTTKKIEKISHSISTLQFDENEYEKSKQNYEIENSAFHAKEKELLEARNKLESTIREISTITKQITEERKKRIQIQKEEKKTEILKVLDSLFGDFRIELISRIIPLLSIKASELFRKITDGKYSNMTLNEDYDVQIEDNGKYFPLKRFSGGEEDLASLCLRIAISQVIEERTGAAGINLIVLDEIFGSQDEMRKSSILKALNELSSQFRQIVLITHVEDIKDLLPYTFNVVETSDNTSKIIIEGTSNMVLHG